MTDELDYAREVATEDLFPGDWDLVPFRASLEGQLVPTHPRSEDFHAAASAAARYAGTGTWCEAAAWWTLEATRERLAAPGCELGRAVLARAAGRMVEARS